jgi:hypothetical protein
VVACPHLGGWGGYKMVSELEQRRIVVACPDLGGQGGYKMVSEPKVSTLNLDGPCMSKLKLQINRRVLREYLDDI